MSQTDDGDHGVVGDFALSHFRNFAIFSASAYHLPATIISNYTRIYLLMAAARPARRRIYEPGEFVPRSGVYVATHNGHRTDHQVLAIRGEVFPACRKCGIRVRFHLHHDASHMLHDMDFAGPDFTIGR